MTIPEEDGKHSQELQRRYQIKEQTLALTESGHKQPQPQVDIHLLKHLLYTTLGERALLPENTENMGPLAQWLYVLRRLLFPK